MKEMTVHTLKELMDTQSDFQLIDVREPYEYEICDLGGELIPMGDVMDHVDKIARDKKVVVHCRSGKRSASVIRALEQAHGFDNLYNLEGGVLAWSDEIDSSMPKY
jgi:adenylyltransferase/sulfurtransferase